jgi:hypothetical protein
MRKIKYFTTETQRAQRIYFSFPLPGDSTENLFFFSFAGRYPAIGGMTGRILLINGRPPAKEKPSAASRQC